MRPLLRLSGNVEGLQLSPTIAIQQRSAALAHDGRDVFRLGLGQSPFPVPEPLVEALRRHARVKDYLPTPGLPELREAIAGYMRRTQGLGCGAEEVLVAPGSKELLFLLQVAFDGEVLIPSPAWVSYAPQARVLHRRVRWLPSRPEDGWRLTPQDLEAACRAPAPRLLVLNYPSNPTGSSYTDDELAGLAEVARRHGIVVLSDEIYGELRFDGRHASIARWWPEGTIVSTGLSKWCGAGGWRLGAFVFPRELRPLLDAMAAVASETYTSTSAPIQHAAVRAFEPDAAIQAYLRDGRSVLEALCRVCAGRLRDAGADLSDAVGAFYLFPAFAAHRAGLAARGCTTDVALCERLLEETGVACLPGSAFGRSPEELRVRLALVDFDGAATLLACSGTDAVGGVVTRHCGRVLEAVDRLGRWVNG